MSIRNNAARNIKMAPSSVIGGSQESAEAVAKLAIHNVLENRISDLLKTDGEFTRSQIESRLNENLAAEVHGFLAKRLDLFKYAVLDCLSDMKYDVRVIKKEFTEEGALKDVTVDIQKPKEEKVE